MKNAIIVISLMAFVLYFLYSQKGDGEGKTDNEKSPGGSLGNGIAPGATPPIINPPPNGQNSGIATTPTVPLNTEFGEGAELIKSYMKNAIASGYAKTFRSRQNVGTNLFPETRKNVSPAIAEYVISSPGGTTDTDVPLIPTTVDPTFLSNLEAVKVFCQNAKSEMSAAGKNVSRFGQKAIQVFGKMPVYGLNILPPSVPEIYSRYVDKYGACSGFSITQFSPAVLAVESFSGNDRKSECIRGNWEKLFGRELLAVVDKMISETKRLDSSLRSEAIAALMQSGYKFTDV